MEHLCWRVVQEGQGSPLCTFCSCRVSGARFRPVRPTGFLGPFGDGLADPRLEASMGIVQDGVEGLHRPRLNRVSNRVLQREGYNKA
jgi:hypothetical protein